MPRKWCPLKDVLDKHWTMMDNVGQCRIFVGITRCWPLDNCPPQEMTITAQMWTDRITGWWSFWVYNMSLNSLFIVSEAWLHCYKVSMGLACNTSLWLRKQCYYTTCARHLRFARHFVVVCFSVLTFQYHKHYTDGLALSGLKSFLFVSLKFIYKLHWLFMFVDFMFQKKCLVKIFVWNWVNYIHIKFEVLNS